MENRKLNRYELLKTKKKKTREKNRDTMRFGITIALGNNTTAVTRGTRQGACVRDDRSRRTETTRGRRRFRRRRISLRRALGVRFGDGRVPTTRLSSPHRCRCRVRGRISAVVVEAVRNGCCRRTDVDDRPPPSALLCRRRATTRRACCRLRRRIGWPHAQHYRKIILCYT